MLTDNGYGTIRPPDRDSYSTWGEQVLNSNTPDKMSYQDYCKLNSCTDEGLQAIAGYNKFTEEWEEEKELFDETTSMAQKRFISIKLYAKHRDRRKYHLDQMEGGHRKVGNFQANFCAQLDAEYGSISKSLTYMPSNFRQVGLTPARGVKQSDIIGAYNSAIQDGSNSKGFFSGSTTVAVRYLNNVNVSVPEFLDACRLYSEALGREKRNSASKDPFVELAIYATKFMTDMSNNALIHRPCLKKFAYRAQNKFPALVAEKNLTKDLSWKDDTVSIRREIPLTDFLYSDSFEQYCRDPFNKDNKMKFMNELEVPCMINNGTDLTEEWDADEEVRLRPPFFVSYDSMAIDAGLGDRQRATTEMLNKWCILPIFIHILLAHKKNKSLVDAARDPYVTRTVLYAMRHHVHNHGNTNLSCHPCMHMIYEFPKTPNLAEGECQVIPAALYLTEIVNAALTTIHRDDILDEYQQPTVAPRRKRLNEEANGVSLLFSTLNIYALSPGLDKMIGELAKTFYIL
jgi:hypothetical protein